MQSDHDDSAGSRPVEDIPPTATSSRRWRRLTPRWLEERYRRRPQGSA